MSSYVCAESAESAESPEGTGAPFPRLSRLSRNHEPSPVDTVLATFPGSRVTVCRTPESFRVFWDARTREHRTRQRAETIQAARLEQLQQQQGDKP